MITATRLAKTPLAIAQGVDAAILFANDAFADLLGVDAASLVGRPLSELSVEPLEAGGTVRMQVALKDGSVFPAALSTAAVDGADGMPLCTLCSLVDARGDGADAAILRDAALLVQVARAASELMQESAAAEQASGQTPHHASASEIASDAVDRAVQAGRDHP